MNVKVDWTCCGAWEIGTHWAGGIAYCVSSRFANRGHGRGRSRSCPRPFTIVTAVVHRRWSRMSAIMIVNAHGHSPSPMNAAVGEHVPAVATAIIGRGRDLPPRA